MSLDRLIREVERGEVRPKRRMALRDMGLPFCDPLDVDEAMRRLDELDIWEELNKRMCNLSYNADVLERGAERFAETIWAAIGIKEQG